MKKKMDEGKDGGGGLDAACYIENNHAPPPHIGGRVGWEAVETCHCVVMGVAFNLSWSKIDAQPSHCHRRTEYTPNKNKKRKKQNSLYRSHNPFQLNKTKQT